MIESLRPILAILVSAVAAILILASDKKPNLREFWTLAAGAIKFLIVISMAPAVFSGQVLGYTLSSLFPHVNLAFRVDPLGLLFATTASFLWIFTSLYSIGYVRSLQEHAQTRYFACFAIALSATMGAAFAANLVTLLIFYELLTFSTFFLVAHKETPEAWAGGTKYIVYLVGSSEAFLLPAILLTYGVAGNLDFSPSGVFPAEADPWLLRLIYILFIAGFAKAAIMPLHSWLPSAMVAPTPVSSLLHAVAVVKMGVFSVSRVIIYVFGVDLMNRLNLGIPTAFFVSFTILVASIIALTQDNFKLMLAYSTVSQLSYIIFGVALLTPAGMTGGLLHIANHAFTKITLFFCAGSIYVAAHKTNISEMRGIGRKMPWTMLAFSIAALGMIGIPPTSGFVSKWYLVIGSAESGEMLLLFVLLASTILNAAYFLPIIYRAFFEKAEDHGHGEHGEGIREAPPLMVVSLLLTALLSLVLGFYPDYFLNLVREVIR